MTVAITRKELGAVELRREARRCRDTAASRRMLALALGLEGASREEAARAAGMDRQTLRDWVHRYNAVYGRSPLCKGFLGEARVWTVPALQGFSRRSTACSVRTADVYPAFGRPNGRWP